jgi:hypothetical protein
MIKRIYEFFGVVEPLDYEDLSDEDLDKPNSTLSMEERMAIGASHLNHYACDPAAAQVILEIFPELDEET